MGYTVLRGHAGPYVGNMFLSLGKVAVFPAFQTILSQRVEKAHQSKCQAALSSVGTAGAVVGVPLYSRVLFRATAQGAQRATPAIFSMLLALLCAGLSAHAAARTSRNRPSFQDDPSGVQLTVREKRRDSA